MFIPFGGAGCVSLAAKERAGFLRYCYRLEARRRTGTRGVPTAYEDRLQGQGVVAGIGDSAKRKAGTATADPWLGSLGRELCRDVVGGRAVMYIRS